MIPLIMNNKNKCREKINRSTSDITGAGEGSPGTTAGVGGGRGGPASGRGPGTGGLGLSEGLGGWGVRERSSCCGVDVIRHSPAGVSVCPAPRAEGSGAVLALTPRSLLSGCLQSLFGVKRYVFSFSPGAHGEWGPSRSRVTQPVAVGAMGTGGHQPVLLPGTDTPGAASHPSWSSATEPDPNAGDGL